MDSITTFYQEHKKDLHHYAQKISREHADDLVQDLFLTLYERSIRCKEVTLSLPYAFRSLHNSLCDTLRKSPPHSPLSQDRDLDSCVDLKVKEDPYYSQCLDRALEHLKPVYRTILSLYFKDELSLSEISERLGLSYQQVKFKKHRGLRQLRKKLEFILREQH